MKLEFSQWIFEKPSDAKFQENLSSGRQDVPFRPNIWIGMNKLIVAFHNFVNVLKKFNVFIKYSNKVEACVKK
jgi:hypothetical protein